MRNQQYYTLHNIIEEKNYTKLLDSIVNIETLD